MFSKSLLPAVLTLLAMLSVTAACDAGSAPINGGCTFCPTGTYALAGATYCTQCPDGFWAPINSVSPDACYPLAVAGAALRGFPVPCDADSAPFHVKGALPSTLAYGDHIQVSGSKAGDVTTTLNGGGSIKIVNDGAFVTATQNGSGRIDITSSGAGVTATNNGGGTMTIRSSCTAAVTVTRTGNGNTFVTATGSAAITHTFTGNDDVNV